MKWKDGRSYTGEWKDDKPDGIGIMRWEQSQVEEKKGHIRVEQRESDEPRVVSYEGEFLRGNFSGIGKMQWSDGTIYSGKWKNGMQNGEGQTTYRNGERRKSAFKDGLFIRNLD